MNGQSLTFESPSAFSIYLKRLINPARKADDGWKTVKYGGKFLEHYKLALARRRFGCAPRACGRFGAPHCVANDAVSAFSQFGSCMKVSTWRCRQVSFASMLW